MITLHAAIFFEISAKYLRNIWKYLGQRRIKNKGLKY